MRRIARAALTSSVGVPVLAALVTALALWLVFPARTGPLALTTLPAGRSMRPVLLGWLGADDPADPIPREPMAVAVLHSGDILVADVGVGAVHRFGPDGTLRRSYGTGHLSYPVGLAVSEDDRVWVADLWQQAVFEINLAADRLDEVETGPVGYRKPTGLAYRHGLLYVADIMRHQVLVLEPGGALVRVLGTGKGQGPGEMLFPNAVWVSELTGEVLVADSNNRRIQIFDGAGRLQRTLQPHRLLLPRGLVEDERGHLYVADTLAHDVMHLDQGGTVIERRGEEDGLAAPNGLALHDRRLYVADRGSGRVVVWDLRDE